MFAVSQQCQSDMPTYLHSRQGTGLGEATQRATWLQLSWQHSVRIEVGCGEFTLSSMVKVMALKSRGLGTAALNGNPLSSLS